MTVSQPRPYRHAYPQPSHVYAGWATPAAAGNQPVFQVRVTKHTGLAIAWYNQRYTVTGTLQQCEAAISQAQQHNLLAGWWSLASVLVWNWVALLENHSARKALRHQAGRLS